jgi:diguanylate cyclase (GGDEF)-like protein
MNLRLTIQKKLFLSHFLAVLLVSGSIGTYFYFSAVDSLISSLQERLKYSAALISETIDAGRLNTIQKASDISLPAYREYLEKLRDFRHTNPDIAYLYIMRKADDKVFFVIDSDETEGQALPGKEYLVYVPTLLAGFTAASVDKKIWEDEWGSFMSGYSPLKNSRGEYLIGMDMRADEVKKKLHKLRISGVLSLLCSIVLAVIFSRLLSKHFTTPIQLLISRFSQISQGELHDKLEVRTGDELDNLIDAFNNMSSQLSESQMQNRKTEEALLQAKENLEVKIEERTGELVDLNRKLVQEISERKNAEEMLERAATSDPLTGLLNRRAMMEQLKYQEVRYQRNRNPFVILLVDLDHFKAVNDTYGHDAGDKVLVEATEHLRKSTRSQDVVSRWGGEEFLILLPETSMEGGAVSAEKVRKHIEDQKFMIGEQVVQLTLSVGVAEYRAEMTLNECIKSADAALYRAKRHGRNRVEVSE